MPSSAVRGIFMAVEFYLVQSITSERPSNFILSDQYQCLESCRRGTV